MYIVYIRNTRTLLQHQKENGGTNSDFPRKEVAFHCLDITTVFFICTSISP